MNGKATVSLPIKKINLLAYEFTVGEVMKTEVIVVSPDTTIAQLRKMSKKKKIAEIVIVDKDNIIGVIEKEYFRNRLQNLDDNCPASEKMRTFTNFVHSDTRLAKVLNKFEVCGIFFPVVDRKTKRVLGTIARCNIVLGLYKYLQTKAEYEIPEDHGTGSLLEGLNADEKHVIVRYNIEPQNFDTAGEAANRYKKILKSFGIDKDIIQRASIIAFEAEMNIVVYSTNGGILEFNISPDKIVMDANDNGPGIEDIEKAMEPGYSTAPDWVRDLGFGAGMGLDNIRNYSDHMNLESTLGIGTSLHSEIKVAACN